MSGAEKTRPAFITAVLTNNSAPFGSERATDDSFKLDGIGGGTGAPPMPPAWERKRTNKRINEQLKLFGSGMNALAAAVLGSSIIVPLIQTPSQFVENYNPLWFLGGVSLHVLGLIVFGWNYQSEE